MLPDAIDEHARCQRIRGVGNPASEIQTIRLRPGLERMQRAGAVVSTVEAALFELLERAGTPEFKAVQKLIL